MDRQVVLWIRLGCGVLVAVFAFFMCVALVPNTIAQTVAAWVQAFGAILAIWGAFEVMRSQQREAERQRVREKALNEFRLLTSIRTEVEFLADAFYLGIGEFIKSAERGKPVLISWDFVPNQFVVFDNLVSRIDIVESDPMRRLLIRSYAHFRALVFVIEMNTKAVDALNESELKILTQEIQESDESAERSKNFRQLAHFGDQIIDRYGEARSCVIDIIALLADDVLRVHFDLPEI